jgi:hypothetical protein
MIYCTLTTGIIGVVAMIFVLADCRGGASPPPALSPPVDPWQQRLAELRAMYEANEEKLRADWRLTLAQAQQGELDADALIHEIIDLTRKVEDAQRQIEQWDGELAIELARRGQAAGRQ